MIPLSTTPWQPASTASPCQAPAGIGVLEGFSAPAVSGGSLRPTHTCKAAASAPTTVMCIHSGRPLAASAPLTKADSMLPT